MSKNMIRPWYNQLINLIAVSICSIVLTNISLAAGNTEGLQVYQKDAHLSQEHKQKIHDDISRFHNADNLWDVLRDEFSLSHYENNAAVQEKIEWYMNNQDFLLRSASRAAPYLYYILQQVKKRHLPAELVLLPIVESGYNPFAISPVGAAGIWQIMPDTASGLGVRQDWWYDGRRDVISSTRAALSYLSYLQSFFDGNWLLAIAAYNTGEGNVLSAIRRNIRDGRDTDFWSLPVAQQTRDYVPSLLALATIISHPDQYPIYFPPVRNAPYLAQVDTGSQINLKYAAVLAGIHYNKLFQLNPGFNRPNTSTKGSSKLILPIENVEKFTENLARSPFKPVNVQTHWIHYKVKAGDTVASISKKFSTSISSLRKMNHLTKSAVRRGTNLLIPANGSKATEAAEPSFEVAEQQESIKKSSRTQSDAVVAVKEIASRETDSTVDLGSAAAKYALQPGDTIYVVRNRDTLDGVAKRFHINRDTLRAANQIHGRKLKPGKELIIPTHDFSTEVASSSSPEIRNLQPGDTLYMVRRGDTIEKIAHKFRTTASSIRLNNLINNRPLQEGERLVVPTHIRG